MGLIRIPASNTRDLDDSKARAHEVADKLNAGLPFSEMQTEYHEGGALNLPDALLPLGKLVDYSLNRRLGFRNDKNHSHPKNKVFHGMAPSFGNLVRKKSRPEANF